MSLIIEVNPTESRLIGVLDTKIFTILYNDLSFRDPDYIHKKAYNPHVQERKYLITPSTRKFQTGLLQRITQFLDIHGLEYEIRDNRIESSPEFMMPIQENALSLRPYQEEAVQSAIDNKCGILRMATGAGKTFVASHLVSRLERRTVILVHRLDLLKQFSDVIRELLHFDVVGICGGGVFAPNIITVCTMQTITYSLDIKEDGKSEDKKEILNIKKEEVIKLLENADVVIMDETHHVTADTFSAVMKRCKNARYRFGLTATDWRDDGSDLLIEAALGPRLYDINISSLVEQGYLVPAKINAYIQYLPDKPCSSKDNWQTVNKCFYAENENFHRQVLEVNRKWFEQGKHILTLVSQIKHGVKLEKLHNANGIRTIFLSGSDSSEYREKIFNEVRSGKLRHLISTSIADEGLDLPVLDALNIASGGKSSVKVYQRIGRTLRTSPGKTHAEVVDYIPQTSLLEYHYKKRRSIYRHEKSFEFIEEK